MTLQPQLDLLHSFDTPGTHLCGLAWDGTHLWYSDGDTSDLYRLNKETGEIVSKLPCPDVRTGLAYDGKNLWQVAGYPKRIRVVDPHDGQIQQEIALGGRAEFTCGLFVEDDTYWTGPESNAYLEQYSLASQKLIRKFGPVSSGDGIVRIGSSLWYTSYKDKALIAINLETGIETKRYRLIGNPTDLCWDGSLFWYNDYANKQICAVQPTNRTNSI